MTESALVVLVREAEALVGSFRDAHDRTAALGMPAHITVLYPFLDPDRIDAGILRTLRDHFRSQSEFELFLVKTGQFPGVLYLAPEPAAPLVSLIDGLAEVFPGVLPYGGRFSEPIPHLTVAEVKDPAELPAIAERFARKAEDHLPIAFAVSAIALMEERAGRWHRKEEFPLGTATGNGAPL